MMTGDVSLGAGFYDDYGTKTFAGNSGTGEGIGSGRVNIPLVSGWNEELEAEGLWSFDGSYNSFGVFSHTYTKSSNFAGGAVLGVSRLRSAGGFTAGVEGMVFLPTASVGGLISYTAQQNAYFWILAAEARYYLNQNTKVTGSVAWSNYDANFDLKNDSNWYIRAELEHYWTGPIVSTFASATVLNTDADTHNKWEVIAGLRVFFDNRNGTLQSHDYEIPFTAFTPIASRAIVF